VKYAGFRIQGSGKAKLENADLDIHIPASNFEFPP
jgi:hypothetical protein